MNDIMNIITNVGFPIACCGALAYYVSETTKAQQAIGKPTFVIIFITSFIVTSPPFFITIIP